MYVNCMEINTIKPTSLINFLILKFDFLFQIAIMYIRIPMIFVKIENLKSIQPVLPFPKKESTREEWLERQHKILSYQPPRPVSFRGRQRGE